MSLPLELRPEPGPAEPRGFSSCAGPLPARRPSGPKGTGHLGRGGDHQNQALHTGPSCGAAAGAREDQTHSRNSKASSPVSGFAISPALESDSAL